MTIIPQKQLTLADIFDDCQKMYENDKPTFLTLLETHINLDEIVPSSFALHFHASTGRPRKYTLYSMLWALIIQRIFSIPTDSLLINFLHYSAELRSFCGFNKVPGASKFTRFKQDFQADLQMVFDRLVDLTEPICQEISYKIRTTVERSINHFKSSFILAGRKTQNELTTHSDLLLSGITQLITVLLANAIKHPELLRSVKSIIA